MFIDKTNQMFITESHEWDNRIAFSAKEVAQMLNLPLSSIIKYMREGAIDTFKIGRHYRVTKQSLYNFIKRNECRYVL